ncbi:MAG: hypothetical protein K1X83_05785 [Oligoflexia bacterium]|nr:hypothetical protein [Oligoflexia bacterium]
MIEQLMNLVREHASDTIINNPSVPNQHNEAAVSATTAAISEGLSKAFAQGQVGGLLALLGGKTTATNTNPIVSQIVGALTHNLTAQCGVSSSNAQSVAANLIPMILTKLAARTADPANSSFTLNGIFNHLSGGQTGSIDFTAALSRLDKDGDGDVDFSDILGQFGSSQNVAGLVGKLAGNFFNR